MRVLEPRRPVIGLGPDRAGRGTRSPLRPGICARSARCRAARDRPRGGRGRSSPLGATVDAGGRQLQRLLAERDRVSSSCSSIGRTRRSRRGSSRSTPSDTAPTTTGTSSCPGSRRASSTAIAPTVPSRPSVGLRFDPSKLLLDPYGRAVVVPDGVQPRGRARPGDNTRDRDEERRRGSARLRLGGRRAAAAARSADRDLRDARARLHAPPELRRRAGQGAAPTPG